MADSMDERHDWGSFGIGFAAGLFGGLLGLIIVFTLTNGKDYQQGAGIGFAVQIFAFVVLRMALH